MTGWTPVVPGGSEPPASGSGWCPPLEGHPPGTTGGEYHQTPDPEDLRRIRDNARRTVALAWIKAIREQLQNIEREGA